MQLVSCDIKKTFKAIKEISGQPENDIPVRDIHLPHKLLLDLAEDAPQRAYTRLRGDGKGQHIFISWSRVYSSMWAKNSIRFAKANDTRVTGDGMFGP